MNQQDLLKQFLANFRLFSEEEIAAFVQKGKLVQIPKNDFFIREGVVSQTVGFITKGILRSYYHNNDVEEVTYCFRFPNELVTAYSSYLTGKGSPENIQAISDVELLLFSKADIEAQIQSNHNWTKFAKYNADQLYLEMEERILLLQKEKAEVRYQHLITEYPEYLQQIPLQYLSSYLGITPRHFSRIRKAVVLRRK